jgi:hypothetical protein
MNNWSFMVFVVIVLSATFFFTTVVMPQLLIPTTLNNQVDVVQHLGYTVQNQDSILHGQTIRYYSTATSTGSGDQLAQWIQMIQTVKPQYVFYVTGHTSAIWDMNFPALFFVDSHGVIYLYQ